ncbi:caspase domain-containing protein [Mesorhizobium sp. M1A.F.Ca.IN.022.04.1.1]|uniref:caspase family protein n=2 Tax=unclassified Mesorhizobium TaxID=325217 RepID=UPI000FCCD5F9|nr:caspase domain-containing protein [Mesorhizobium sp. M1A.F.Ca.IN.022.04.1.1]RUV27046.1 peptidase C14 caspase catalytic subunit p20 [Mesorhizobium sp. M1A.F.Ca.IN.022.04.1.1]
MRTVSKYLVFALVVAVFAMGSTARVLAQGEKRLAFVIGNAGYQSGPLATSANDAGLIAQTLQAAGFDVVGARDVDQESLRGAFRDFLGKVSAAGPDAVVFVYLAGYGVQFEGENYFVPVDAQISNAAEVPIAAVRVSDLTKPLAALPTKVNIIVLDAARPNSFAQSNQPLAGGLALVDPDPNMLIAFNAAPGTVAQEGKGPYGAYAQALAEMIRDGGLQLGDVFDRTRLRVNEVTLGAELPWNASKITAPFVFFDRGPDAPAPQVSTAEVRRMRTRAIRDFDAHDAYVAALDRDTMRGYEDFLVAYPHDPMAKRVRAIIAARREAITWRQTWLRDTPEAYWSYLERYPHGPHAWDARRRLEHFNAAMEPPQGFAVYVYDVPPPPPEEIIYVDRPVLFFDDPEFDFEPPPPPRVIFLPPPPPEFIVLPPPPPPVGIFLLPTPVFVPVPVWVNPPHDIVPPPNNVIFNNIHNTTNVNNTTINETNNQGGLTTGQELTGAAVGLGAATLATKVALPPFLQKKQTTLSKQNPGGVATKLGQGSTPRQSGGATPLSKTLPADKLAAGHALPGADGKTPPLVNGKPPVLNGQNLPNTRSRKLLRKEGVAGGNAAAVGNAGAAVTGGQGAGTTNGQANGQGQNAKFSRLPIGNGAAAGNGLSAQQKVKTNNPSALAGLISPNGKLHKIARKQDASGGGSTNGPANRQTNEPRFHKLPAKGANEGASVQQTFKNSSLNGNPQRQDKPKMQFLPKPLKPEFRAQLKPQNQERRQAPPKPQQPQGGERKKPTCGHPGEPVCKKSS